MSPAPPSPAREGLRTGWPLYLGMAVAGAAAVVASASTLAGLARAAGWAGWTPWLLPAALDVGGSAGGWCWLRPGIPERARRFGRVVALVGAAGTLVGNAAGHLLATGYLAASPLLVVIVGAVPAAVLMALAHLAALLTADRPTPPRTTTPRTSAAGAPAATATGTTRPLATPTTPRAPAPAPAPAVPATSVPASSAPAGTAAEVSQTRAAVLAAIRDRPATVAELVRATGRSRTTVVGHLTALTADGTLVRGHDKRFRLDPTQPDPAAAQDSAEGTAPAHQTDPAPALPEPNPPSQPQPSTQPNSSPEAEPLTPAGVRG